MSDLAGMALYDLKIRQGILRQIIRESETDPRIGEPKRQLAIIESEIERQRKEFHMADTFQGMTVEQLEAFRVQVQAQIESLREQFVQAGLWLETYRAQEQKDRLVAQKADIDQQLAQLEAGKPPAQVVKLKTLDMRAKAVKSNG